ncbi:MAG: two-component system, chemotaxis family, protein-glutamate methylesterase/glutaminase [Clostridia bacterium]|jgi:two-component system chemotaxis response regulator CheB|nr:two-component system, chemotaxis family, protein-glutamate methylesterase/glutaminase [Clostridia bacterium]MDN5322953.1 two-component system, chemotaxis family, protein-glutamate methylesterase/glutaminase [Clostridia bacterium]
MSKIRVLVVDDSAFMRKVISDIVNKDDDLELAGTARDGLDAIAKINELKPDVITLDVEMPKLNGLQALEKIMTLRPTPVIMLSSLTQAGTDITIKALAKGAIDFVQKPGGAISLNINQVENEIIKKIKLAYKVNLKQQIVSTEKNEKHVIINKPLVKSSNYILDFPIILLGTSTGGPKALHKIFENLPSHLHASILVVQHMPPGFTKSLAQRLDNLTDLHVKEAEDGEPIKPGYAYIAPGNYQMEVKIKDNCQPIINVHQGPLVTGHRPSVDALFNSVAQTGLKKIIAVIMTGMGHDGREGMKKLKNKGCITIAESEETCVVFGMPKAAIETGCVDKIVPLSNIVQEIIMSLNLLV